jgi:hypothetical protein
MFRNPRRKREKALRKVADQMGFTYVADADPFNAPPYLDQAMWKASLELTNTHYGVPHHLRGESAAGAVTVFDIHYEEPGTKRNAVDPHKRTQAGFRFEDIDLPPLRIEPEDRNDRFSDKTINLISPGWRDIDFDEHPAFSDRYALRSEDPDAARALFTRDFIDFWMSLPPEHRLAAQVGGKSVLVYREPRWRDGREGQLAPALYPEFVEEAARVALAFRDAAPPTPSNLLQ